MVRRVKRVSKFCDYQIKANTEEFNHHFSKNIEDLFTSFKVNQTHKLFEDIIDNRVDMFKIDNNPYHLVKVETEVKELIESIASRFNNRRNSIKSSERLYKYAERYYNQKMD